MLYQFNVLLSICGAILATFYLISYVSTNKEHIFFWTQSCETGFDCLDSYMTGPPKPSSKPFQDMIRSYYMIAPPSKPNREPFDIHTPVWRKLVDWYKVQESLHEAYKTRAPGTFVEIGAVDGNFMSQTIGLERNLGWSGLLLEPDPRSFAQLKKAKRNAWLTPLCVNYNYPSSRKYWIRTLEEDLPHHFLQLLMARSKVYDEILAGDEERGTSIFVPCVPISTILKSINMNSVDLLTIATGGDEDDAKIKDAIHHLNITVKALLIHYPTSRLYKEPYPEIPGYVLDAGRSEMLVKFYVKENFCQLLETSKCELMNHFDVTEACDTHLCFDFLRVKTFSKGKPIVVTKTSS